MFTYYDILEVEQDASLDCIKKVYRKMQLENHPDKTKHLPETQQVKRETISKAANVAYEVLSDPTRRSTYDEALASKCPPVPRSQPQQPPTPPDSPLHSNYAPKPDTDPANPPYTPHCRLGKFSKELHIKGLFSFSIRLNGAYEPYDWGPNTVFQAADRVTILLSIRELFWFDPEKPDVAIAVTSTPSGRRVTKIESIMTCIGAQTTLRVTIFAGANFNGHLYKDITANRSKNSKAWHYSWCLDPPNLTYVRPIAARQDEPIWGKCQIFTAEKPHKRAIFLPKPSHEDNPWGMLLRDGNLNKVIGNGECLSLIGSANWLHRGVVEVKGMVMWRVAACAHLVKLSG